MCSAACVAADPRVVFDARGPAAATNRAAWPPGGTGTRKRYTGRPDRPEENLVLQGKYAHELKAGDRYDPLEFKVTPDLNQQFLYAVEDYAPIYLKGRGGNPPLVHPVLLMHMSPRTRSPSYRQAPGMGSAFARERSRYLHPGYVGGRFTVTWTVIDTYEQRGRIYQDYVAEISDERGRVVLRRELASTFFMLGKNKSYGLEEKS